MGDSVHPILIAGEWRAARQTGTFQATNPNGRAPIDGNFPVSSWEDIDAALAAAHEAERELRTLADADERIARFLEAYADGITSRADALSTTAHQETGLPVSPRLKDVELPRTTNQLRLAASAVREGSWRRPTIDTKLGLRSCLAPIGPVWVIGPNNFPFAFNAISGGDFAAAIAAGNPVVAKAHPLHPATSSLLAEAALDAARSAKLPAGMVQMIYHMDPATGFKLIADARLKAVAFTGSRHAGLQLKAAADGAGKPFFGEMSSINPVVILPGALAEGGADIAQQFVSSVLMGTGQFCTNPGLVLLLAGTETDDFLAATRSKLFEAPIGTLFSEQVQTSLLQAIQSLRAAGAEVLTGGSVGSCSAFCVQNTLLKIDAGKFLANPQAFSAEAFGNASLAVVADSVEQLALVIDSLEGNLTGTIYSASSGADDAAYDDLSPVLRAKVGRLINDRMPTGVAVSPAMNHGGPFPATSQPHFTAVGIPASILRFAQLQSFDNVRPHRLPACLRDKNPTGKVWRSIDGAWTTSDLSK